MAVHSARNNYGEPDTDIRGMNDICNQEPLIGLPR